MATDNDDHTGRRIRRRRRELDLSQAQLADRLHVTRQTVNNWENSPDAAGALSIDRLTEIAAALGATFAELVPGCDVIPTDDDEDDTHHVAVA